jgi:N utilization substance protein A
MSIELMIALQQIEKEKGVDKETLIEAIEAALLSAYKRNFGSAQNVRITIDRDSGDVKVFSLKDVAAEPQDPDLQISVEDAKRINPALNEGDVAEVEVTPKQFGRIAAQTAKQVVVQRIREAERNIIFDEFASKENDIVTGIVRRFEKRNIIVDLGKVEGILTPNEQSMGDTYNYNDRIKVYVVEVKNSAKGPQVMLSRTHPGLVKRLFELEVPEIHEGIVEIRGISREAGSRTKIAVFSREPDVDPVGACVGQKGVRVQAVVSELSGEKIDIIKWSSNPQEFISSSLSPAKVIRVDIGEEEHSAKVIVPDFQLSLAIGKEGQNARLAAKLTGWKIDIKSESQLRAAIEEQLLNFQGNYNPDEEDEESYEDVADGYQDNEGDDGEYYDYNEYPNNQDVLDEKQDSDYEEAEEEPDNTEEE